MCDITLACVTWPRRLSVTCQCQYSRISRLPMYLCGHWLFVWTVTFFPLRCDMTLAYAWHDLFVCVMCVFLYGVIDWFICVTARFRISSSPYVWRQQFGLAVTVFGKCIWWVSESMCACVRLDSYELVVHVTLTNYMQHYVFTCVTWLVRMCAIHHAFKCVTWRSHMCNMTHSPVWHDSFVCVTYSPREIDRKSN